MTVFFSLDVRNDSSLSHFNFIVSLPSLSKRILARDCQKRIPADSVFFVGGPRDRRFGSTENTGLVQVACNVRGSRLLPILK